MTLRAGFGLVLVIFLAIPILANANVSTGANPMCIPWNAACPCGKGINPPKCNAGGPNKANCPPGICIDNPPGGSVPGICEAAGKCKGTSTEKGGIGDAKQFMDMMSKLMEMLKGKDKGEEQPPPPPNQGCTQYIQVSATPTSPCEYYVSPTSGLLTGGGTGTTGNSISDLLGSIGGSGESLFGEESIFGEEEGGSLGNVSDTLSGIGGEDETSSDTTDTSATSTGEQVDYSGVSGQQVNLLSGTRGNIEVTGSGVTVTAGARDAEANTEVTGFYGSATQDGESQGVIAKMCRNRPWAESVVTYVIPPSFFDSLCAWRGYQVGVPKPPSQPVVVQQVRAGTSTSTSPTIQLPAVKPEVDIWAVPARVSLGTRTSIFWNTRGVETCKVTSPDGSFNENALSGGAATVPLSGETTFTISCLAAGGEPVTDHVTVGLSI